MTLTTFQSFLSLLAGALILNAVSISNLTETEVNYHGNNNKTGPSSSTHRQQQTEHLGGRMKRKKNIRPHQDTSQTYISSATGSTPLPRKRFPTFGSREFNRTCRWAVEPRSLVNLEATATNCAILARPSHDNQFEGISAWIAQVVAGFIVAKQARCQSFYMDYGPAEVIISNVLSTPHHDGTNSNGPFDWRTPINFTCNQDENCFIATPKYSPGTQTFQAIASEHVIMADVPGYRYAYGNTGVASSHPDNHYETGLQNALGNDFQIATSMACAMGSLISLGTPEKGAVQYQHNLWETILPTLHDPNNALVLSLYIRTGHTEDLCHEECIEKYRAQAESIIQCALQVEEMETVEADSNTNDQQHVVWMLVTDSQFLKSWITKTYSFTNSSTSHCRRTILTTQSRGAHTKSIIPGVTAVINEVSTTDFAEAFLDWYLIGESDAVISDFIAPSYGNTAAFRTARPYYKVPRGGGSCSKMEATSEFLSFH